MRAVAYQTLYSGSRVISGQSSVFGVPARPVWESGGRDGEAQTKHVKDQLQFILDVGAWKQRLAAVDHLCMQLQIEHV